ncbi:MAG TPA: tRNA (adenosine(37)-N6)-threonylcarbamoyltransferase complex dimerization subunit type 1 TsaB [Bacilli bacterium]|nr:tRNA (adenosine(37)-N6)-threonylcarbamoyltransferase complex dimerization subunit type 1 TsaB [Bacilli bacterium]
MILLLDSSSTQLSVALSDGTAIINKKSYYAWQSQSELMIPEIINLLKEANLDFKALHALAVSIGPGSYTGVRIALTIAKIIGYALHIPVYTGSSLQMLRNGDQPTICLINARSGRSYFGVYQGSKILVSDSILTNEQVLEYIGNHPDYSLGGALDYLGLQSHEVDIFANLLALTKSVAPINDIHALKPVYLKDHL